MDALADRRKDDEAFLRGGTYERAPRAHAPQVLLAQHPEHDEDLPAPVHGGIAAAADEAWRWWRATGRCSSPSPVAPARPARTVTGMRRQHTLTARTVADAPHWDCSCGHAFSDPAQAAAHTTG